MSRTGSDRDYFFEAAVIPAYHGSGLEPVWIESVDQLEALLGALEDDSLSLLDIWGHGAPGRLELGATHHLTACRRSYRALELARDKFTSDACLRLCGCGIGSYLEGGRCGPALALELANALGIVVKAMRDSVIGVGFPDAIDRLDECFGWAVAAPPGPELFTQCVTVELVEPGRSALAVGASNE